MALALWSSRILTGAASRNSKCWTPWSSSSARSSIGSIRCFEILIDPKALSAATSNKKAKSKHNKNGGSGSGSKRPSYRFVDKTRVRVVGGHGGKGCLSQQQMRRKHKLRPDGGHGGNGGSVIIVADPYEQSLRWSQPHLQAEKGSNGMSQGMSGRNGKNLIVRVPCGVVVKKIVLPGDELYDYTKVLDEEENTSTQGNWGDDEDYDDNTNNNSLDNWNIDRDEENNAGVEFFAIDEEGNPLLDDVDESSNGNEKRNNSDSNENTTENPTNGYDFDVDDEQYYSPQERRRLEQKVSLADLDKPGANIMVARGGRGGYGSIIYASVHGPLPDAHILIDNAKSQPPEVTYLELELKLIADIGTIGFPNAGKSSLLRAMSRAAPEVAPYPFTTLHPLMGVIEYRDGMAVKVADIPGLIAGASEGRGKGIDFLRHVERTKALMYVLDAAGTEGRDPIEDLRVLVDELSSYGAGTLLERDALVVANKVDLIEPERLQDLLASIQEAADDLGINRYAPVAGISAGVSGEGLAALSRDIRGVIDSLEEFEAKAF